MNRTITSRSSGRAARGVASFERRRFLAIEQRWRGAPLNSGVMRQNVSIITLLASALTAVSLTGCSGILLGGGTHQEYVDRLMSPNHDERNEYGWICEYSTVGMPPMQRLATLALVRDGKVGLLRDILAGENLVGRVYAADALIYLSALERTRLTLADRAAINELRGSGEEVRTCGNEGSYRVYLEPVDHVLSDSAIALIPDMYEMLLETGYGRR